MNLEPGQPLQGGNYTIKDKLPDGGGGFGITYLAEDRDGRELVIKTLNSTLLSSDDKKFEDDFWDEAKRLRKFRHKHIVQFENFFTEKLCNKTLCCMVMEYIEGQTIDDYVEKSGILSEAEALLYTHQIGEALTVVHREGLLHRDVKPRNIMLRFAADNNFEAVLIDFGIAREFQPGQIGKHTTFRSEGYAPIEQYRIEVERNACTDIYALAATLYYLLTKQVPSPALEREIGLSRDRTDPLLLPQQINPKISDRINQAILWGMQLQAQDRPQSVEQWLECFNNDHLKIPPFSKVVAPKHGKNVQPLQIPIEDSQGVNSDYPLKFRAFLINMLLIATVVPLLAYLFLPVDNKPLSESKNSNRDNATTPQTSLHQEQVVPSQNTSTASQTPQELGQEKYLATVSSARNMLSTMPADQQIKFTLGVHTPIKTRISNQSQSQIKEWEAIGVVSKSGELIPLAVIDLQEMFDKKGNILYEDTEAQAGEVAVIDLLAYNTQTNQVSHLPNVRFTDIFRDALNATLNGELKSNRYELNRLDMSKVKLAQ
ncbi:MAG: serine/threonine protein kinase [Symploca sp. SIO2D2]|nr:serine/threonine protein kinase [Symploca sp. SIO2D2]